MMYSWIKPEPFFIEFGDNYLHGDLLPKDSDSLPEILFLHGEQNEGRGEFLLLRQVLLEQYGISSCAFDFIGYGSTGGKRFPLHLQERVAQASDIINACFDLQAFSIVAADRSAEVALSLTSCFPVRHLVVLNPPVDYAATCSIPCQIVETPVVPTFLNNTPAFVAKTAGLIKDTLLRCQAR